MKNPFANIDWADVARRAGVPLKGERPDMGKVVAEADPALNQVYLQLHQIQRRRGFVEVTIKGDDMVYQSIILALDPEERSILIDELFPRGFSGLPGQHISVSIREPAGRRLQFNSEITSGYILDGAPVYVLAMPAALESDQRRAAYRLPISERVSIPSTFVTADDRQLNALLRNVSASGVCMEMPAQEPLGLRRDDALQHVAFDFAGINFDCRLQVKNIIADERRQRLLIGGRFVDLPVEEQRLLEKSIMRIQRERIQYSEQVAQQLTRA